MRSRVVSALCLFGLLTGLTFAATPVAPVEDGKVRVIDGPPAPGPGGVVEPPPGDDLVFPLTPATPPVNAPTNLIKLPLKETYVFESRADCVIRTWPDGIIQVEKVEEPMRISAVFVYGDGHRTTRQFTKNKYAYQVDALKDGRCVLFAFTKTTGNVTQLEFECGNVGPEPKPPVPPGPDGGDKQLVADLKAAYSLEPADQRPLVKELALLYGNDSGNALNSAKNWGDLFDALYARAQTRGLIKKLSFIDRVIQKELQSKLPSGPVGQVALTPDDKNKAADVFGRIAKALSQLTP